MTAQIQRTEACKYGLQRSGQQVPEVTSGPERRGSGAVNLVTLKVYFYLYVSVSMCALVLCVCVYVPCECRCLRTLDPVSWSHRTV